MGRDMSTAELIKDFAPVGIKLWCEAGKLKYESIGPLPDVLLAQLKLHKQEIMEMLGDSITGFQCKCGSTQYKQRAFLWKDMNGRKHWGFSCLGCATRYWMV
jgi:hypothetical protein